MEPTPTHPSAADLADRIIAGGNLTPSEALHILRYAPLDNLVEAAHRVTQSCAPRRFDFCAIVNAKSGRCSENCKWCAQSAHWQTSCEKWEWIGSDACLKAAQKAEADGATRFGIVTSGRTLPEADIQALCHTLRILRQTTRLHLCASIGLIPEEALRRLKEAGLERLHCNLETAPSRFSQLCTTHTTQEKIDTLGAAQRVGLQTCCGGIIGMGETDEQLVEFAFALRTVHPDSIPVNILHPIPGTPLGQSAPLPPSRIIASIALIRLVNPDTPLRFAGGRRDIDDQTAAHCIRAGISAGIAGPLLTTPGADFDDDRHLAALAGFDVAPDLR